MNKIRIIFFIHIFLQANFSFSLSQNLSPKTKLPLLSLHQTPANADHVWYMTLVRNGYITTLTDPAIIFPPVVDWDLTVTCPFKCFHCRALHNKLYKGRTELSTERAKDLIDLLSLKKVKVISWCGLEPLNRSDFPELARYAKSKGLRIYLYTTGFSDNSDISFWDINKHKLNKDNVKKILDLVDFVNFSIDPFHEDAFATKDTVTPYINYVRELLVFIGTYKPELVTQVITIIGRYYDKNMPLSDDKIMAKLHAIFSAITESGKGIKNFRIKFNRYSYDRTNMAPFQEKYQIPIDTYNTIFRSVERTEQQIFGMEKYEIFHYLFFLSDGKIVTQVPVWDGGDVTYDFIGSFAEGENQAVDPRVFSLITASKIKQLQKLQRCDILEEIPSPSHIASHSA